MSLEDNLRRLLNQGKIGRLFVTELLWDRPHGHSPVRISDESNTYEALPVAAKKNFIVYEVDGILSTADRSRLERAVSLRAIENMVVYKGEDGNGRVVWTEAKPGRAPHAYVHNYIGGSTNADVVQRLLLLRFNLADQASLNLVNVRARVQLALAADRVTKAFYDTFSDQQKSLSLGIENIPDDDDRSWYSSVLLNRLMFLYFLQRKGFLDGDSAYLRNRLSSVQTISGPDQFYTFFRDFLLPLFHTSLASRDSHPNDPKIVELIGQVPYLNGGMFSRHELEKRYEEVNVPDSAFHAIFTFFDSWKWTLDDKESPTGNEINPDILGYIFERYINQKQMGAYYTKEDVTGYMTSATLLPVVLDRLSERLAGQGHAFSPYARLLCSGDRYLYVAPLTGVDQPTPSGVADTVSTLVGTSTATLPSSPTHGLPGESWIEALDRIESQRRLRDKLVDGSIKSSADAVTNNINLTALVIDVLRDPESPQVVNEAYTILTELAVVDPTCGSGAFLFAALDLLVVLYRSCIESMEYYLQVKPAALAADLRVRFESVLNEATKHPSRDYFLHKSVALNNLYGVDVMPEAVEIAKLRLFLSLVQHVDTLEQLEPLPDLDFHLKAGNSLIGFATERQVVDVLSAKLGNEKSIQSLLRLADDVGQAYARFNAEQVNIQSKIDMGVLKANVENTLDRTRGMLNLALAVEYDIEPGTQDEWEERSTPFHWFTEFYSVMHRGGFDVVIGNPPYVAKTKVGYKVVGLMTSNTPDIYAPITERAATICAPDGRLAMILPISAQFSEDFRALRDLLTTRFPHRWVSTFSRNPAALFDAGLGVRSTIVVCGPGTEEQTSVTRLHRWVEAYRPVLFEAMRYTNLPAEVVEGTGSWPRTISDATATMTAKMLKEAPNRLATAVRKNGEHQVGMKSIGLYWISCYDREPPSYTLAGQPIPHTAVRGIPFENQAFRDAALAVMSSKAMLFWWATNGDDFNVTGGLLTRIPVDLRKLNDDDLGELSVIGRALAAELPEHVQYTKYAGKWMGNFVLPELRHITDRADALLARVYGYQDSLPDLETFYFCFYKPTGERPGTLRVIPTFV